MESKSFQEIRQQYPSQFLVLVDPEEQKIGPSTIEVVGAMNVYAYESGEEMFAAYKDFRKQGISVRFCTPQYKDKFLVEQIPTLGIFGS